jgi:long-subunit acyl-CoA synthetase (AMP-forming)
LEGLDGVQLALTGAAPISPELIHWYQAIGVPLREGWNMTETTGDVGRVDADGDCLSAEDEELTPTMKLKRALINRKYAALIEGLHTAKAAT